MTNSVPCPQCGEALAVVPAADVVRYCHVCKLPRVVVAGKYEILRTLAKGGCGTLYIAKHQRLQMDPNRVIKFIDANLIDSTTAEARFAREVEVTSSLSQRNQHIVRVYDDFGDLPGLGHYFVMEYLEGQDLSEYLQALKQELPMQQAIHIIEQVALALMEAHSAGIVHRDLKPQNIFLVERHNDPLFVKVIDFGIAKAEVSSAQMGMTQGLLGTPAYMSPEQCSGLPVDHRSDIYSIGILLFQLIVGRVPFGSAPGQENSPMQLVFAQVSQQPPKPREIRPYRKIPEELEAIILKLLEKEPANRFQSLDALLQALASVKPKIPDASSAVMEQLPPLQTIPSHDQAWDNNMSVTRADDSTRLDLSAKEPGPTMDMPTHGLPTGDVMTGPPVAPTPLSSPPVVVFPQGESSSDEGFEVERGRQSSRALWLGGLFVIALVAGVWFVAQQRSLPPQAVPDEPHGQAKPTTVRNVPSRERPAAPVVPDEPVEVVPEERPKPVLRKVAMRRTRRSRRRRRRVRRRRTVRRKPVRPRATKGVRGIPGCPADTNEGHWVLLQVHPRRNLILRTQHDSEQRRRGYCLFQKKGGPRHYVRLIADGYAPCFFRLGKGVRRIRATLKLDDESAGLSPNPTYCLK
ncbi:MAG: serine/threonine protein kinase [Deltaproteobacteria bacterium]|nr:MAG: serine/threonine protein kinase [Deltaproteobacteria bacterium]